MAHDASGRGGRRRGRPPTFDRTAALDATRRVIATRGLDRTRYADIAEASGVAVSTLQHAFGRLDEILALALDRAQELDAAFLLTLPGADEATAWERIELFIDGTLGPVAGEASEPETLDGWLTWIELWRAATRDPRAAQRLDETYDRWRSVATEIITDGQRDGSFMTRVPAGELSIAVNAVIDGVATGLLLRPGGGDLATARQVAAMATRRILAARDAPSSG